MRKERSHDTSGAKVAIGDLDADLADRIVARVDSVRPHHRWFRPAVTRTAVLQLPTVVNSHSEYPYQVSRWVPCMAMYRVDTPSSGMNALPPLPDVVDHAVVQFSPS